MGGPTKQQAEMKWNGKSLINNRLMLALTVCV